MCGPLARLHVKHTKRSTDTWISLVDRKYVIVEAEEVIPAAGISISIDSSTVSITSPSSCSEKKKITKVTTEREEEEEGGGAGVTSDFVCSCGRTYLSAMTLSKHLRGEKRKSKK